MNNFSIKTFCLLALFISGLQHATHGQNTTYSNTLIDSSSIRVKEITFSEGVKEEFIYDERGNI